MPRDVMEETVLAGQLLKQAYGHSDDDQPTDYDQPTKVHIEDGDLLDHRPFFGMRG